MTTLPVAYSKANAEVGTASLAEAKADYQRKLAEYDAAQLRRTIQADRPRSRAGTDSSDLANGSTYCCRLSQKRTRAVSVYAEETQFGD